MPHLHLYEKLQFFTRKKIINEMNKKICKSHTSFLFFSLQPNTIQTLKNLITTVLWWVYFSIKMVGFNFYSNPNSSISLGNTENQTKREETKNESQNLNHIDHKSSKCPDQK